MAVVHGCVSSVSLYQRLLLIQLKAVVDVEIEGVEHFGNAIPLRLRAGLSLSKHGGRHQLPSILALNKTGGTLVDGSTLAEGSVRPQLAGLQSARNGLRNNGLSSNLMVSCERLDVVPRVDLRARFAGLQTFSIDDTRDFDLAVLELRNGLPEQLGLFRPRCI